MDVCQFNQNQYDKFWKELNKTLRVIQAKEGLPRVIEYLWAQQFNQGFIQDDLKSVIKYLIINTHNSERYFTIQFNPKRNDRFAGAGRNNPPPGVDAVNGGCFLCRENVMWQQRCTEIGYEISTETLNSSYIIWVNPFPIMPNHITVANKEHIKQSWVDHNPKISAQRIEVIFHDFLDLLSQLPGYIGFYNGEGAGATIPGHFHFQFFKRHKGAERFALERETARMLAAKPMGAPSNETSLIVQDYPITAIYFHGSREYIVKQATGWIDKWTKFYDASNMLSANIIGSVDENNQFSIHFVPRNSLFSKAPGMAGNVAGLEVLGELVYSTDQEKELLVTGHVSYDFVTNILRSVEPPDVKDFLKFI